LLKLYDHEASGGQFETLETFLREESIPYCRWSEGKYEYDAEAVAFHPRCGQLSWPTDHNQDPIVLASQLAPIDAKLTGLLEAITRSAAGITEIVARIEAVRAGLRAELPPVAPPLESLEIVED
jgi:hypothetical protein